MTDEILKKKSKQCHGMTQYMTLHKKIRNKCRQEKESWLDEIERMSITDKADMHKKVTGQKTCSSTKSIKSKDGTLVIEKRKKYFGDGTITSEVFYDNPQ